MKIIFGKIELLDESQEEFRRKCDPLRYLQLLKMILEKCKEKRSNGSYERGIRKKRLMEFQQTEYNTMTRDVEKQAKK